MGSGETISVDISKHPNILRYCLAQIILIICILSYFLRCAYPDSRSPRGTRVAEIKQFYRGEKVTAIGAISMNKVLALMTMNDSMNGQAFAVFIEKFLCPELWKGAVVVMDNLPAHKLASIVPMIEAVGASVICLSPYSRLF